MATPTAYPLRTGEPSNGEVLTPLTRIDSWFTL